MASAFDDIARELARDIEDQHGERLRFEPLAEVGYTAASPDPDRMGGEIVGVVLTGQLDAALLGASRTPGTAGLGRMVLRPIAIQVSGTEVTKLGWRPRKGDRVLRLDRVSDRTLEIGEVNPLDFGNLVLVMVSVPDLS
jgi:hypothetical protein